MPTLCLTWLRWPRDFALRRCREAIQEMALRKLASGFNRDVPPVRIFVDQWCFLALCEFDPRLCCTGQFRLSIEPADSHNRTLPSLSSHQQIAVRTSVDRLRLEGRSPAGAESGL